MAKKTTTAQKKKTVTSTKAKPQKNTARPIRREVGAVVCLLIGLLSALGYFIDNAWLINAICYLFKGIFGFGFYIIPPVFFLLFFTLAFHKGCRAALITRKIVAAALIPLFFGAVLHLFFSNESYSLGLVAARSLYFNGRDMTAGGVLSGMLAIALKEAISIYGAAAFLFAALVTAVCLSIDFSPAEAIQKSKNHERIPYEPVPAVNSVAYSTQPLPAKAKSSLPRELSAEQPASYLELFEPVQPERKKRRIPSMLDIPLENEEPPARAEVAVTKKKRRTSAIDIPLEDEFDSGAEAVDIPEMPQGYRALAENADFYLDNKKPRRKASDRKKVLPEISEEEETVKAAILATFEDEPPIQNPPFDCSDDGALPEIEPAKGDSTLEQLPTVQQVISSDKDADAFSTDNQPAVIDDTTAEKLSHAEVLKESNAIAEVIEKEVRHEDYRFPPITLLQEPLNDASSARTSETGDNEKRLNTALQSFGIKASVKDVTRGPSVTRYDLELEAGVKLNKITNLAGDIALALGVSGVRIAPIPDKIATVGVEVPNRNISTVYLREIIASHNFSRATSKLTFAIGKDIGGECIVGNISKLPHMLIAGTTGSGKSVCMNSLILSLLYKASPDELRLIMIDPKMVELGIYNGIPHLYIPVVTDPKKAAGALQWAVVEMLKRYRYFSDAGVRDLAGYNNYQRLNGEPTMPNVVIVIDELADLMMTAAKEVEESICRVAQMGRAAGMHLVIATQRPSADVITGLMKANIPSRIAFAVSSSLESRIIMDQVGAEKLIGKGDMLYAPLGCLKPMRIQGTWVSDEEREQVIQFIKDQATANYDESVLAHIEKAVEEKNAKEGKESKDPSGPSDSTSANGSNPFAGYDDLLPQAVDAILDAKQASVSMLQRRLKLGYSRAARIVDEMEELGIVGPFEGSKPRQIIITKQQWQEMTLSGKAPAEKLMDEQKDDFSRES